ncbi:MAG: CinA family protein, partial [Alistipes sp.]|nr:CinA family protein [Alistipes sp.]
MRRGDYIVVIFQNSHHTVLRAWDCWENKVLAEPELERTVVLALKENNLKVATAESCTGGL